MTEQELKDVRPGDILTTMGGLVFGAKSGVRPNAGKQIVSAIYVDPISGLLSSSLLTAEHIRSKATTQECSDFQSALATLGHTWNMETGTLEKKRWRSKKWEKYEYVFLDGYGAGKGLLTERKLDIDDALFSSGNYFRPGTAPIEEFRALVDGFFKKYRE